MITQTLSWPEFLWTLFAALGLVACLYLVYRAHHNLTLVKRHARSPFLSERLIVAHQLYRTPLFQCYLCASLVVIGVYSGVTPNRPDVPLLSPVVVWIFSLELAIVLKVIWELNDQWRIDRMARGRRTREQGR